MISDEPFTDEEFFNWKYMVVGGVKIGDKNMKRDPGSPYDRYRKKYVLGGSELILAKKLAQKNLFDFKWKDIAGSLDDKGEKWITDEVERNKSKIEAKWLIQKQCHLTNEIAVIRSKQQRMVATKDDEEQLNYYQNEMAELRNMMSDVREKYKRDNPRTYGIVNVNERNIRMMLEEEEKEMRRYKK